MQCLYFYTALLRQTTQFIHFPFKVHNLVHSQICATITTVLEHFLHLNIFFTFKPFSYSLPPASPSSKPQATTNLHFVSMDLPVLNISSTCKHVIHGLLRLASSTEHGVLGSVHAVADPSLHISCLSFFLSVCTEFLLMAKEYSIMWLYHILLIHSSVDRQSCLYFSASWTVLL